MWNTCCWNKSRRDSRFLKEEVGTLVEVENVEQLANAIIDILKDRKKFDREYIAKYVKDNHSQDVLTQELIDVYEQALNL